MDPIRPISAAIVGLSPIAAAPAGPASSPLLGTAMARSHAASLARIPEVTSVAACDLSEEARDAFSENWTSRWPGLKLFSDFDQMLQERRPDFLVIAIPDTLHETAILKALEHNVPMIMLEKPMAVDVSSAERILAAVEASNTTVAVNTTRRWYPTYVAAQQEIEAGGIGELRHVKVHFSGPRAMLWRNHTHMLDLLAYFAKSDPITAYAELETGFEDYGIEYRGDGGRSPDLEPGLEAMFSWANGVRGHIYGMKNSWPVIHLELTGTTGRILVNDTLATLTNASESGVVSRPLAPNFTVQGIEAVHRDIIASHAIGTQPEGNLREAIRTVRMIDAALRSQAEGNRRVEIPLP